MKTCTRCKEYQDDSEFYPDKRNDDELKSQCKTCHKDNQQRTVDRQLSRRHLRLSAAIKKGDGNLEIAIGELRKCCREIFLRELRLRRQTKGLRCNSCEQIRPIKFYHFNLNEPFNVRWLCVSCDAGVAID